MLIRFCALWRDPISHSRQGVVHAACRLLDDGLLEPYEEEWLENDLSWLNMHLPIPCCLGKTDNDRAICWFRPDARKMIDRMRGVVALLETKGVPVETVKTLDPGTVIYHDQWQVIAKPRRKRSGCKRPRPWLTHQH